MQIIILLLLLFITLLLFICLYKSCVTIIDIIALSNRHPKIIEIHFLIQKSLQMLQGHKSMLWHMEAMFSC